MKLLNKQTNSSKEIFGNDQVLKHRTYFIKTMLQTIM